MEFNPISRLDERTSPAVIEKARGLYARDSLNIKLKSLRERRGLRQADVANFTQTAISKLEGRKDMRISTLIDYLESLGMGLEISALSGEGAEREVLLRVEFGDAAHGRREESLVAEPAAEYRGD